MQEKSYGKLPDIIRTIIMDAPINKVWDAVSTSEGLAAWLMPNDFKPQMGYEFTFVSQPKRGWNGIIHCKVMELNPPQKLGFTWNGNNMEQYVSFELKEIGERTEFTLVHSGWTEEHLMIREVMYDGWGHLTEDLKQRLGEENERYLS